MLRHLPFTFSESQWRDIERRHADADDAAFCARISNALGVADSETGATYRFLEMALDRFRQRGLTGQRDLERLCLLAAIFGIGFDEDPRLAQAPSAASSLSDYVYAALAARHTLYPFVESGGAAPQDLLAAQLGQRAGDITARWRSLLAEQNMPTDDIQLRYLCVFGEYWWFDPRYGHQIHDPNAMDAAISMRQTMAARLKHMFLDVPVEVVP